MLTEVELALTPQVVAPSVDELLGGTRTGEAFVTPEVRSGSRFERVWVSGRPFVLKLIELDHDFLMRASGDIGCRPVRAYAAGLFDVAPDLIDHAVVGAAGHVGRNGWGGALLMRDMTPCLVPPGDAPFEPDQHLRFLDHLAGLCARTWGWRDTLSLLPYGDRWRFFGDDVVECERALGWPEAVPAIVAEGWERFDDVVRGALGRRIRELRADPTPLSDALAATPSCFLHGDWKASNLGTAPDGRTVLLDWAYVGEGPACHELGWYLALNRAKLPVGHGRELVIADFRAALERHGVVTEGWWDRQLRLALLGTLVQFGWEKALGQREELGWWCDRAVEGLATL